MNGLIPQTSGNVAAFYNQPTQPSGVNIGDLWFDNVNTQFKQWDGTNWNVCYLPFKTKEKNAITNGNMDIWQRGTSFTTAVYGSHFFTADKWRESKGSAAGAVTVSQSTDVPTFAQSNVISNYSLMVQVTTADTSLAANEYLAVYQPIEGYNFRRIAQRYFTISFWVKAFKPGIYGIGLRSVFSAIGFSAEYSIDNSGVWEKKVIVVPPSPATLGGQSFNYTNGLGLDIWFTIACDTSSSSTIWAPTGKWVLANVICGPNQTNGLDSTNNYFKLSQVQVEPGMVATPFEQRNPLDELSRCQRYCWATGYDSSTGAGQVVGHGRQNTANAGYIVLQLPVTMRATPTLITVNPAQWTCDDGVAPSALSSVTLISANSGTDRVWIQYVNTTGLTPGNGCIMYGTSQTSTLILEADLV